MSAPRPSSFLGGPFLVNVLHRLPIPLVDAIFNNPRTFNDTLSPPILFNAGLTTLSQGVRRILVDSFPELPVEALNHLVSESTSSPFLADLVSCWGLRWRALQLSAPSSQREEEVFVRIVGGIQLHKDGDSHVYQYLGVVMGDPVRELKVELETNGNDDVRSLFVKRQLQAPPSPPPPPPPPVPPTPPSREEVVVDPRRVLAPADDIFLKSYPTCPEADPQQLHAGLSRLRRATRKTILTHPSANPCNSYELLLHSNKYKPCTQALRSLIDRIILSPGRSAEVSASDISSEVLAPSVLSSFTSRLQLSSRVRMGADATSPVNAKLFVLSIFAGIERDLGLQAAINWCDTFFSPLVSYVLDTKPFSSARGLLENRRASLGGIVRYDHLVDGTLEDSGWRVRVVFNKQFTADGEGSTRSQATSAAALALLESGTLPFTVEAAVVENVPRSSTSFNVQPHKLIESSSLLLQNRCSLLGMTLAFQTISRDGDAISTVVVVAGGRFSAEGKGESAEEAKEVASRLLLKSGILPEPMEVEREIVNDEPSSSVNHHQGPSLLVEPAPRSSSLTPATRPSLSQDDDPSSASSVQDLAFQPSARSASLRSDGETCQQQVESNEDRPSTSGVPDPIETEERTKKKKKRSSTQLASVDSSLPPPPSTSSTSALSASQPDLLVSSSTPDRILAAHPSSSSLPFDQLSLSSNVGELPSHPSPLVAAKPKPKPPTTPSTPSRPAKNDPRKRLFDLATQLGLEPPSFKSKPMRKDERGVDVFLEKVFVGEHSEKGTGWSKDLAQQKACRKMLESGELGGMEGVE